MERVEVGEIVEGREVVGGEERIELNGVSDYQGLVENMGEGMKK